MYDCIQVYEMQWYSATADRLCNVKRAVTETGYSKVETTCQDLTTLLHEYFLSQGGKKEKEKKE